MIHRFNRATGASPFPLARLCHALARHRGDQMAALSAAEAWTDTPEVGRVMRAAVAAGTTSDADWASGLADYRAMSGVFVEQMRPATILGRLAGVRDVPGNKRTLKELNGSDGGWVGEGASSPISKMSLDEVTPAYSKCQTTIVVTDDLVRALTPQSEAALNGMMVRALAATVDRLFIDPTVTLTADGPASITNLGTSNSSTGASTAQVTADLKAMCAGLVAAGSDLTAAQWVLHPRTALALSLLVNTAGAFAFPGIGPRGGSILGLPAITSGSVPIDTGDDTRIVLLDASRILVADEGLATVDVSHQSSIQLVDNPATGAQSLVSLWQNNLVGIRLTRWITWELLDAAAVQVLEDVSY